MDKVLAWTNRIGGILVIVGIVGVTAAGGDAEGAVNMGYSVAGFVGGAIIIIKEVWQYIKNKQ